MFLPRAGTKRKYEESDGTQTLDVRSVKKLHRLMRQSRDDCESSSDKTPRAVEVCISGDDSTDEEVTDNRERTLLYNDIGKELDKDFDKFFKSNPDLDNGYSSELLQNIDEAKSTVAEELQAYSGSFNGDFEDLEAGNSLEELPEDLRNHINLLKDVLTHYRSGPLPKTIKMLPHLPGFDTLLEMLEPLKWTNHLYPKVVKVFASKGGEQAMHFNENYLLPKVRSDIRANHRLSVQLFDALIFSIFRTEEFLSSIFLPWIRSEMTKTEGLVLAHLVKKASIRAHFSSVALVLILGEEFSIPRSMLIEVILNKKYFLPEKAIGCLVKYFVSFADKDCSVYYTTEGRMPVTWFKSLLTFLEFYREGISVDERRELLRVCKRHRHPSITPDVRALIGLIPKTKEIA